MKRATFAGATLTIAISTSGASAQSLSPDVVFEGAVPTAAVSGTQQSSHVTVKILKFNGPKDVTHELPVQGFYIAHLRSGAVTTTIDGQTTRQPDDAYWTVRAGATMKINVLSELAVIETIVVTKQ
jgi:hypothetical protein